MATKTTMSTNFKPETVKEIFSKVKGHSTLVKLEEHTKIMHWLKGAEIDPVKLA